MPPLGVAWLIQADLGLNADDIFVKLFEIALDHGQSALDLVQPLLDQVEAFVVQYRAVIATPAVLPAVITATRILASIVFILL